MKNSCLWVYILECDNGSFYTGYTVNVVRRYWQHRTGNLNAKFTRSFKPLRIAQCWKIEGTKGDAMRVESYIKKQSRSFKERVIASPDLLCSLILEELEIVILPDDPSIVEKMAESYTKKDFNKRFNPL